MSNKIAIIGKNDAFMGFRALGVEVIEPAEGRDIHTVLESLDPERYAVVFIIEQYAQAVIESISERNRRTKQAVIIIPSGHKRTGVAGERIRQLVRRAVGADIL